MRTVQNAPEQEYFVLSGVAQRQQRHSCFILDALVVIEVTVSVDQGVILCPREKYAHMKELEELIPSNPADKVERPKKGRYVGSFYDTNEVQKLFEAAKGTHMEIPVFLGAFYGLRRSEVLGLRWDAVDFTNNTLTIKHTVTSFSLDGKKVQVAQDTTKTKSSMRTLPLVPAFRERLLALRDEQDEHMRVCGRCYNRNYLDYICVDEMGTLLSPNYVSSAFSKLLEKHGLRHIRFHDLRHSCASLLLANGVPMKQIQEWLGHSDFSTTANIYAHLDYSSKLSSAEAMVNGLGTALESLR